MKAVVLAEKPSVARDIARVLKCGKHLEGALEGERYIVTWGLGHLVELADPEEYDDSLKEWKMEDLPMIPQSFRLSVIRQTARQYRAVKAQLFRKDVDQVIIATDAGREGELVARLILEKSGCGKPIRRLWISSVTDKAIKEGFASLKDGRDYNNLRDAALCRAKADWLVGMNATRAMTCKYNAQLSCGRVQTPTLAMIAKREREIKEFVPKAYYGLKGEWGGLSFQWQDKKSGSGRSFDKKKIQELLENLSGKPARVTQVKRRVKEEPAPLLYDLTELQREANKRYQYSAKETLNLCQRLYENHKVLTYPRTDSRYLSSDILSTIPERLKACGIGPYRKMAAALAKRALPEKPFFADDKKVTDHHAIIPTEQYVQLDHMTIDERRIYDLVVRRFLAVLCPPSVYEEWKITVTAQDELFAASARIEKEAGWRAVYEEAEEKSAFDTAAAGGQDPHSKDRSFLEEIKEGDVLQAGTLRYAMTEGKTAPPPYFTEGTLLSAMENPAAYMESAVGEERKALAKTLGETGGLGTVATRADIIEKLFNSFLVEKKGQEIHVTAKGRQLLELVPEDLRSPELTAQWETRLSRISQGQLKSAEFMEDVCSYTKDLIEEIRLGGGTFRHDNLTNKKCPQCGKRLLAVKGKNSEMLVCQDRECGYRETVSRTSNARCPKCHKKMLLTGSGEKKQFVCSCGYKEKLSSFTERKKKEGAGVSKKDVARYLKQQKQEEEAVSSPLAAALAKIHLDT